MKLTKKCFSLLLCALMIVCAMPIAFAAADDVIATGDGGEGIVWTLTEGGVLTVSGNGPIVDKEEYEYDDEGEIVCISKIDCLGWQVSAFFEQMTEGYTVADLERARFDFVKTLVIEEGITAIPDDEFSDVYPRSITLPSTVEEIGASAINAGYAESLTIGNKDLPMFGGVYIPGYRDGAKPFASIDEAIDATVDSEVKIDKINRKAAYLYDLQAAYEIKIGIDNGLTKADFLAYFNEAYGKSYTKLITCINFCLKKVNKYFGTDYSSADEVFSLIEDEGFSYLERKPALDEKMQAMYDAVDISDSMVRISFGNEECCEVTPYHWLTVNAPSGSTAEKAAKKYGLTFNPTTEPEPVVNSCLGKVKQFFAKIKARIETVLMLLRLQLGSAIPGLG